MMITMTNNAGGAQALVNMGFTALEAEIYTFIVGEPGVTGYRVAQAIGKPAANTYKSLESLGRKGALVFTETLVNREPVAKLHHAVPF